MTRQSWHGSQTLLVFPPRLQESIDEVGKVARVVDAENVAQEVAMGLSGTTKELFQDYLNLKAF